jgi:hypothetical protein
MGLASIEVSCTPKKKIAVTPIATITKKPSTNLKKVLLKNFMQYQPVYHKPKKPRPCLGWG